MQSLVQYSALVFIWMSLTPLFGQTGAQFCEQTLALKNIIQKEHTAPKPLNDSLSKNVFELFIGSLDPDKRFFTKNDIESLKADELMFDDYLLEGNYEFIQKYILILESRIDFTSRYLNTLYDSKLDYSGKDTLYFTAKSDFKFFNSEEKLKQYWNKKVRYKLLNNLLEQDSILERIKTNFSKLEKTFKPKAIDQELCALDRIKNQEGGIATMVQEAFLNSFANYQDPNTQFFNSSAKNVFETSLSSSQFSFGFSAQRNNDGDLIVANIIPGSVAFKNESIEENDVIKSFDSGKDVLDIYCASNADIDDFMKDENHLSISLKLKKKDGSQKTVNLKKSEIKVMENITRAYLLEHTMKMGYVNIPSFYTDFESPDGLGLANDLAKELYKLEKEGISGLILDLRYNGGGSMREASDIVGMFIDRGPLAILKYKDGETQTMKDGKRGTLFSKPILILINHFSASASEYIAAALQDYNRAIIVGSPSYGKSSAQVILPLDEEKELGFCKVTVDQFYRVTGKSTQSVGVIPDIELPDMYDNFELGEKFDKYSLLNDMVTVSLKHKPREKLVLESIKANSSKRIKSSNGFMAIEKINTILLNKYINVNAQYSLTLDNIHNDQQKFLELWKEYTDQSKEHVSPISAKNTKSTIEILAYNENDKEVNKQHLIDLAADIYLEEAHNVLTEFIKTNNSN